MTQIYFLKFVEAKSVKSEHWGWWLIDSPLYTVSAHGLSFVCIWCFVVHNIPVNRDIGQIELQPTQAVHVDFSHVA